MDRFCRRCGQALRPNDQFCGGCGGTVEEAPQTAPSPAVPAPPPSSVAPRTASPEPISREGGTGSLWIVGLVIVFGLVLLVGLAAAGVAFYLYSGSGKTAGPVTPSKKVAAVLEPDVASKATVPADGPAFASPTAAEMMASFLDFTVVARQDPKDAGTIYLTEAPDLRWQIWCDGAEPMLQDFFQFAHPKVERAKVGFVACQYHPWSDCALLTHWVRDADGDCVCADYQWLCGDFLRGGDPPYDLKPAWLKGTEAYLPAAIVRVSGKTLDAFSEWSKQFARGPWLDAFPQLKDAEERVNQDQACIVQLQMHLERLREFAKAASEGRFEARLNQALQRITKHDPSLAKLAGTDPKVLKGITALAGPHLEKLHLVVAMQNDEVDALFMQSPRDPNVALYMTLKRDTGTVDAFDVLPFGESSRKESQP